MKLDTIKTVDGDWNYDQTQEEEGVGDFKLVADHSLDAGQEAIVKAIYELGGELMHTD